MEGQSCCQPAHLPGHGHRVPGLQHPHQRGADVKRAGDTAQGMSPLSQEPWEPEGPAHGWGLRAAMGLWGQGSSVPRGSPGWEHGGELASKGTRGDTGQAPTTSPAVF